MARSYLHLWIFNEKIDLRTDIPESIVKISSIKNHIFMLTENNNLLQGFVQVTENGRYLELEVVDKLKLIDIGSYNGYLFIVSTEGLLFRCNENLESLSEICLFDEYKCNKGHSATKIKVKVKNIAVGQYGQLFISEQGQLWGCGYMPQIGINTEIPEIVQFFSGRLVHSIDIGNDFAIAIVNKRHVIQNNENVENAFHTKICPKCVSTSLLTYPGSENSLSEICPLGVKVQASYNIETNSNSSKNESNTSLSGGVINNTIGDITEKSIFRNTEAAKEFFSRQISRMSSVGEEYLVECAERPTRIIKENMSSVASLVFEGVRAVGDKVVTLSKQVSGSSDHNNTVESDHSEKINSKDQFEVSVSHSALEKYFLKHEIEEDINAILNAGMDLINREVWTWGNIVHGQLGIGDKIKRELPMIISKLSNIGVSKVSVENCHAAVVTIDGRSYIWGQNNYNQVTLENNIDQSSPKLFPMKSNESVKDITCGNHFTLVLTSNKKLLYFGKGSEIISSLNLSNNQVDHDCQIPLFKYLISNNEYSLLNEVIDNTDDILNFLVEEQKMVKEMTMVQLYLIKPLQKKVTNCPSSTTFENVCKCYIDLLYFWAANIQSVMEYSNNLISVNDIVIFKHSEEHIYVYNNYITAVQNVISIDGFRNISKLVEISQTLYKLLPDICHNKEKNDEQIITVLFMSPIDRMCNFTSISRQFCNENKDMMRKWNYFSGSYHIKQEEAEKTKNFWQTVGKNIDYLKCPHRRLIQHSQKCPIYFHNASRFSSHWFVLFSDLFVHINGSSPHLYNLTMIWIEPHQDEMMQHHQIVLKMPEEIITLSTVEAEAKIEWFHILQQAIKIALNKSDAVQLPVLRRGSYVFTKPGFLKDAKYTGRWSGAKMHGTGKLEWPNGKTYTGHFVNNQLCGYGTMEIPEVGIYEGEWKDNQQNGFGTFVYANTDVYKGHFKNGVPHGHGCLRKGNFMANAASLYIGEWVAGAKSGYGVMDDIVTGEKYVGNWNDNKKQGNGLIVTCEGIYYEGTFTQDTLMGHGIMILDDGTYEGEFRGTGILNGKGVLTLPSGYKIEGNLIGSWNEGIKINGTFTKKIVCDSNLPKSFELLCTPVHQKWKALFNHCYEVLGISEPNVNKNGIKVMDTPKVWQNVAVYLSNATTNKRNKGEVNVQDSLNQLDFIPPFGRDKIDLKSYEDIKSYLSKAFESNMHPLGFLLNNICESYTTTYNGKVHPLLLPHAITELIDITKRLYEIVTYLFPALPVYGKTTLLNNDPCDEVISYQSLVYPILLPKVHNTLFILLALNKEKQEKQYKKTLTEWNQQSDTNLMAFLSVDQKFWKHEEQNSVLRESIFIDAVEMLQQLKSMFSPTEKLMVIRDTIEKMTQVAQIILGSSYIWNMDDLFPLFLYVVVRARIPDLGSELEFIDKFMDPNLENGELGIMFTTLKACYQQILQEKSSS